MDDNDLVETEYQEKFLDLFQSMVDSGLAFPIKGLILILEGRFGECKLWRCL
jgi:hypothetical protein